MKKFIYSMLTIAMAAFTFTSCEDVPAPYDTPTADDSETSTSAGVATGDGSLENPFNSVAANEYAESLGSDEESDDWFYIKGRIVSISEEYSSTYGNATFYISDDGTSTDEFYVYRAYYLGNQKWTEDDPQIEEGDSVIVYAKLINYSGSTPETVQGSGYLYYHNGETGSTETTGEASGSGTLEDPFNCTAAIEYASALDSDEESDEDIYIKGIISSISEEFTSNYGNATFYISDDGSTSSDEFYVYRAYYLGNRKWTSSDTQIQVGDEVIICGKVTNYYGSTPETVQNEAYIYSLNGVVEDESSSTSGEASGSGTLSDPYNCVAAIEYASALSSNEESDEDIYIEGIISSIEEEFSSTYGNATFYISDDGSTSSDEFYVFRAYYLGNQKWTSGNTQIQVGDKVIICGKVTNYYGNTPETVQNEAYIYSLNGVVEEESSSTDSEASGSGTLSDPYNCVAAIEYTSALGSNEESDEEIYIKGIISSIEEEYNSTYGNATFYISDDGSTSSDEFYVYRAYYLGNEKWVEGNNQIEVGDEVIIYGKVVNYYGDTPETVSKEAYLYSLNGSTVDTGEEEEEEEDESDDVTTTDEYISFTCSSLGLENGEALDVITLSDGTTLTFDNGSNSNSPKYYDNGSNIRMYPTNTMTISSSKTIESVAIECDEVSGTICNASEDVSVSSGSLSFSDTYIYINSVGSTSTTVTNTSSSTGTVSQIRFTSMTIYYAE